jgi:glycosyltransferase involved in cell wall biosynthesis
MALALRPFKKKNKLVLSIHSKQDVSFRSKRSALAAILYDKLTSVSLEMYDLVIADNSELLDYYQEKYNYRIKRKMILPPPVDTDVFRPLDKNECRLKYQINTSDKIILFAGRIEKEKNPELLIHSYKILVEKNKDVKLWIVGEGTEKDRIQILASSYNLSNIVFWDTIESEKLSEFYNMADILSVTSLHEGGPIVVKEALACNLQVVSTDVGDVKDVISGLDGCFIAPAESGGYADCLENALLYNGPKKFNESIEKYSGLRFAEEIVKAYEML